MDMLSDIYNAVCESITNPSHAMIIVVLFIISMISPLMVLLHLCREYKKSVQSWKIAMSMSPKKTEDIVYGFHILMNHLFRRSINNDQIADTYFKKLNHCMRFSDLDKIHNNIHDKKTRVNKNTVMFVFIHYLTHLMYPIDTGGNEFLGLFRSMLEYSVEAGIYKPIDYSENPTNYYGVQLTSNPLFIK